jgi:large subunit ribosomal protein L3
MDKAICIIHADIFMKFILGTKQQMTQTFDKEGRVQPVTVLKTDPIKITQLKTLEKDGYAGVQVGVGSQKKERLNKAQQKNAAKHLKEFRVETEGLKVGDSVDLSQFEEGDKVQVSAISKGKGFQGGVKRHGFHGGNRTHGNKHAERQPGSIGATGPQRVFKGTRMAGRMGGNKVTVKNLKIIQIDKDNGLLLISGAIPGRRGTLVEVRG